MDEFLQINAGIAALREKAARLPMEPGVYLMKNSEHKIIYIGKAKLLKNRVNQYFHCFTNLTPKTVRLVGNIRDFDWIVTETEYEALLLESSLIKQHKPKYNILLKDDKGRSYIKISPPPWAQITVVHRPEEDGSEYMGPYLSGYTAKLLAEQAIAVFRLPTCGRTFGPDCATKPCLNYHIKQCYAPCRRCNADEKRHAELISDAKRFIRRGDTDTLKQMREEMDTASEALDFERAASLRDSIRAIERVRQSQNVIATSVSEADVIGLSRSIDRCCVAVISIRGSCISDKRHFFIDDTFDDPAQAGELRRDFLVGFYSSPDSVPPKIYLDGEYDDPELISRLLSEKRGKKTVLSVPSRGEGKRLVEIATKNAFEQLALASGKQRESGMLEELSKLTGVQNLQIIEAYDVSNTSGADNMAAMVVFADGKPLTANYRRFNIKSFEGQDDYASMCEAVTRRYRRFLSEAETDKAFRQRPDLILADGGRGQVGAVLKALEALGITDIPVLGMVKDSRHRTRALVDRNGGEIEIRSARGAFTLVSDIQEEVHRFVITSHRNRRSKRASVSILANIPGIGPKRITALMEHFKTIDAISKATEQELADVPEMSAQAAKRTKKFFEEEY